MITNCTTCTTTYNDVKLCVDVLHAALLVEDGQGGDALLDEDVDGLNEWRLWRRRAYILVGTDTQLAQRLVHEARQWQISDLQIITSIMHQYKTHIYIHNALVQNINDIIYASLKRRFFSILLV